MKSEKDKPKAVSTESNVIKGTTEMGYWEFKKEICNDKGWRLRRVDPQTYEVLNSKKEKIGIFKSYNGYFPIPRTSKQNLIL